MTFISKLFGIWKLINKHHNNDDDAVGDGDGDGTGCCSWYSKLKSKWKPY